MHQVLVLGCGKIGRTVARLLASAGDYAVRVADVDSDLLDRLPDSPYLEAICLDAADAEPLARAVGGCRSVVSALSHRFNRLVSQVALASGASYFDLTEDRETARAVRDVSRKAAPGQVFIPQCGLAPGFVSIVANHLTESFDRLDTVQMRVGALPQFPSNALKYNLTWSTDGLINEYCNPCEAIHGGRRVEVLPLEGLESFSLDGVRYEAFNTSGGVGTLCETLDGRVRELNYRTVRYLGHRDLMTFLVNDLGLGRRRELLQDLLEYAIPVTYQDVVVIFASVTGWQSGRLVQISDARKIYARNVEGEPASAIQLATAAGVSAVLDLHVAGKLPHSGFVKQEQVDFDHFINNRFGRWYRQGSSPRFSRNTSHPPGDYHVQPHDRQRIRSS